MKHPILPAAAGLLLASSLGAARARAQCRPPADSHEARLLAFYEAPVAFSFAGVPPQLGVGGLRLGAEAIPVPSPPSELQHPSYCYQYTTNNTRLVAVFGRPRLTIGLVDGFSLEASFLPPISVGGARASVASIALMRTQTAPLTNGRVDLTVRLHATAGAAHGAITCPRSSLQLSDAAAPCYGTQPSRDTFHPDAYGAELAVATREARRVSLYAGSGVSFLRPRFRAGFTDALRDVDHTTVDVDLTRATAFVGATLHARDALTLSAQIYAVPSDVTTLRVGAQYRIR